MSLQLFNIPDWDGNAESALSCGRPMPKRTACQLVKKARQVFLTALLPPSILPGAKCCFAQEALIFKAFLWRVIEMGLLQNAVFRPKQKICALKKLSRTAALTCSR